MSRKKRTYSAKKKDFFSNYLQTAPFSKITPPCHHFNTCGGCRFQDLDYQDQLQLKKDYLSSLNLSCSHIYPAKDIYGYRNRMDFLFLEGHFALRQRGSFDKFVILTHGCLLVPKQFHSLLKDIELALQKTQLSSYDLHTKKGFLRYVTFRFAPTTNQVLVFFSTNTPSSQEEETFSSFLKNLSLKVTSIYWQINASLTDTAILTDKPIRLQLGSSFITENINGLPFSYSPFCFFQNNTSMTNLAIEKMSPYIQGHVLDLCCGVGTLGLALLKNTQGLTGIELVEEAITYAKHNAQQHKALKAKFFCTDAKNIINHSPTNIDTLLIDPSRSGLGKKTISRILSLHPQTIVYLSCNPKSFSADLKELDSHYELLSLCAFDFFPQTPHIEILAVLKEKQLL